MPSFDVQSEIDLHELTNAVDQANRELQQRVWWLLAGLFALSFVVVMVLYRKLRVTNGLLGEKNAEFADQEKDLQGELLAANAGFTSAPAIAVGRARAVLDEERVGGGRAGRNKARSGKTGGAKPGGGTGHVDDTAAFTAVAQSISRVAASMPGAGASSITFW